jgi:hypothetical protein
MLKRSSLRALALTRYPTVNVDLSVDHAEQKRAGNPAQGEHDVVNAHNLSQIDSAFRFRPDRTLATWLRQDGFVPA